jgi:hypothetical protein
MCTREQIKKTAIEMVKESGLINLSKHNLCNKSKISEGSFNHLMECTFLEFINELKNESIPLSGDTHHKVVKTRTDPELRKDQILNIAINLAIIIGCHRLTRDEIASKADVSMGLVTNYFGTMKQLKRTVMRAAIKRKISAIVAFGIVDDNVYAKKVKGELKRTALELVNTKKV